MQSEVDVDKIQLQLGTGCFQILTFLILGLIYSHGAWHVFGIMFLAGDPGHKCALPHPMGVDTNIDSPPSSPFLDQDPTESEPVRSRNYTDMGTSADSSADASTLPTKIDFSSTMLYAFHVGDAVDAVKLNWTAQTCAVSYMTPNGSSIKMTEDCPYGWLYGSEYETTVLSEWDLVCGREYLVELSITVFMVGAMAGAMLILPLADRFGRKQVMMACLISQAIIGTVTAFVNNYVLFTILRCIIGMLNIGIGLCSYVLITETFPAQNRTVMTIAFQGFWGLGVMTVAGFGYLIRHWRHLELLLSLPNLLTLPCYWLLPESLPWLISQKRWTEAQATSEKIARLNGKDVREFDNLFPQSSLSSGEASTESLPVQKGKQPKQSSHADAEAETDAMLVSSAKNNGHFHIENGAVVGSSPADSTEAETVVNTAETSNSILELFRHSRIRTYCCVMFFLFFVNSLGYFGISFSVPVLHGNPFVNLCVMGAVEIPALFICVIISQRVGRRLPNALFLLLCGVCNIVAIFIPSWLETLKLVFVMLGKFAITAAYSTIYLYSAEIFPTANRNQAMGMSSVFENIGSIIAPLMVLAAKSISELPLVVFGVLGIVGSCLTLLLPETHNRPLPQTVREITTW